MSVADAIEELRALHERVMAFRRAGGKFWWEEGFMDDKKRTVWERAERHAKDHGYLPGTDEFWAFIAGANYGYKTAERDRDDRGVYATASDGRLVKIGERVSP